jgi:protein gp37
MNINSVFIIEIKAVFLNDDYLYYRTNEDFYKEIEKKYIKTHHYEPKAIVQLANTIKKITKNNLSEINKELNTKKIFFPIIVVQDNLLTCGTQNNILTKRFSKLFNFEGEIQKDYFTYNGFHIKNLVIISIDDLEDIETSIDNFSFEKLIENYSKEYPERLTSLHNYIHFSEKYKNKLKQNIVIVEKARKIIDETKEYFFGT